MGSRTEGWRDNEEHKGNDRVRGRERRCAAEQDGERKRGMGSGAED